MNMQAETSDKILQLADEVIVSVILVTYNAAETLQKCLNSIYNQMYPYIEIIVIDGRSTDNTIRMLEHNTSKIAYWESKNDEGIYYAMNKGLAHITGQWVYFIGADDELLPDFSNLINHLHDPYAIYYASVSVNGAKRLGKLTTYQMAKYGPYHQAMIYPKRVFDKYKFDTHYVISADFALTLQLCGDSAFRFIYKDFIIANFNDAGISGTDIDVRFQKDKAGLILKNFGFIIWMRYRIRRIRKAIIQEYDLN
jgi:glycosyltransferase involved in cell wall biosynthesis